jgi:hypothetical protein
MGSNTVRLSEDAGKLGIVERRKIIQRMGLSELTLTGTAMEPEDVLCALETVIPAETMNWEKHLVAALSNWSPPAPTSGEVTIEGDEVYTQQRRESSPPQ